MVGCVKVSEMEMVFNSWVSMPQTTIHTSCMRRNHVCETRRADGMVSDVDDIDIVQKPTQTPMGFDLDAILHHTSHMNTHSRCFTTLCIMSQHVHFHFVNGDNNSEQPLHSHPTLLTCPMMNKQYIMQIDVICESSCNMVTCQFEFSECCVWFQCFTQWCCSCASNLVTCWYERKREWVDCR